MSKIFLEYKDRNEYGEDRIVSGYFELIEKSLSHIIIKSGKNKLTIPFHRIEKIKEKVDGDKTQ